MGSSKKLKGIHYRIEINNNIKVLDIVLEDALVESKYWTGERTYK